MIHYRNAISIFYLYSLPTCTCTCTCSLPAHFLYHIPPPLLLLLYLFTAMVRSRPAPVISTGTPSRILHYGLLAFLRINHPEILKAIVECLSTKRLTRKSEEAVLRRYLSQLTVPPKPILRQRRRHGHLSARHALSQRTDSSL